MTTVIHHSADFDGIFCREIAHKFLPNAILIGWDFGDPPLEMDPSRNYYVMDLPIDKVFGLKFKDGYVEWSDGKGQPLDQVFWGHITWIDHHKSAIDSHPKEIPGLRIEGVAACRLAFQFFTNQRSFDGGATYELPGKQMFIDRVVAEPLAVRLAGEYDIWDKRDYRVDTFQCGLKTRPLDVSWWKALLAFGPEEEKKILNGPEHWVDTLLEAGAYLEYAQRDEYSKVIAQQGFLAHWHGVNFLACNSHELDIRSQLFEGAIKPEHDALLGFTFTGHDWRVSMYHIKGKEHVNILDVAKANGGGGHPGACGCRLKFTPAFVYLDSASRDAAEVSKPKTTNEADKPVSSTISGDQPAVDPS